ncbi:hypothetical protein YB2330_004164 [Saitoella coloradoensis]
MSGTTNWFGKKLTGFLGLTPDRIRQRDDSTQNEFAAEEAQARRVIDHEEVDIEQQSAPSSGLESREDVTRSSTRSPISASASSAVSSRMSKPTAAAQPQRSPTRRSSRRANTRVHYTKEIIRTQQSSWYEPVVKDEPDFALGGGILVNDVQAEESGLKRGRRSGREKSVFDLTSGVTAVSESAADADVKSEDAAGSVKPLFWEEPETETDTEPERETVADPEDEAEAVLADADAFKDEEDEDDSAFEDSHQSQHQRRANIDSFLDGMEYDTAPVCTFSVVPPSFQGPLSEYRYLKRKNEVMKERHALNELPADYERPSANGGYTDDDAEDFEEYELSDFCIYRVITRKGHAVETTSTTVDFVMLSEHNVSRGVATLYFDGVISSKSSNKRFYVEKVPFTHCSVGKMDVAHDAVDGAIWIQSPLLTADGAWYLLKNPSPEYERFWTPFLWLANFAKHVVDFMSAHESVCLADFETRFARWVYHTHHSEKVGEWIAQGLKSAVMDFRQHFATNVEYLWKEACNIPGKKLNKHPIWEETHPEMLNAIKAGKHDVDPRTVVTPGMFECFKNLFPDEMRVLKKRPSRVSESLDAESEPFQERAEAQLDGVYVVEPEGWLPTTSTGEVDWEAMKKIRDAPDFEIRAGDVVAVEPEKIDGKVGWKSERLFWSAYVNEVVGEERDKLRLTWLYWPEDTTIGDAYYPNPRELFFSDHCMCDTPKHKLFPVQEVLGKLSVDFRGQEQHGGHEYYVRQKYEWYEKGDEWSFRTLKQSELRECPCLSSAAQCKTNAAVFEDIVARYSVGNCVYFDHGHDSELEGRLWPKRIVRIDLDHQTVSLQSFCPTGHDNELYVDTGDARIIFGSHLRRIGRKCTVERVGENEELPPAQQQHGAGDYWFYRYAFDLETRKVISICDSNCFDPLVVVKEAKERKISVQPLRGLDLFCGGGSFAHGVEDAGGVEHKWAVDYDTTAMHTYRANVTDERHEGRDVFFWEGSVNTFLSAAMSKAGEPGVPQPGEVEFVVAGSPCQGFSTANRDKTTAKSRTNCSLVASVASYVDFYRPKYALLENVVAMKSDYKRDDGTTYNVCNQMVAACVSMGYQLRLYVLGAYLYGAPQKRERIFISLAAPGLTLPERPAPTHAPHNSRVRISSKDGSGHQFRDGGEVGPTPFAFRSASEAVGDLPDVGDAQVVVNVQYPHHIVSVSLSKKARQLVALIPKSHRKVRGKNWSKSAASYSAAVALNRIPHCLRSSYLERHRLKQGAIGSYCRFDPRGLIPTVLTQPGTLSMSASPNLHYDQNRVMTIEEARRAQGFLARDVILGTKEKAWKIVGNAVARPVALALGVSLRHALEENAKLAIDVDA